MSNTIQIKRGDGIPANGKLVDAEIGYSTSLNRFYIGNSNKTKEVGYLPAEFPSGTLVGDNSARRLVKCPVRFHNATTFIGDTSIANVGGSAGTLTIKNHCSLITESGSTCTLHQPTLYRPTLQSTEGSTTINIAIRNSNSYLRLNMTTGGLIGGYFPSETEWKGANLGAPSWPWHQLYVNEINSTYTYNGTTIKRPLTICNGLTVSGAATLSSTLSVTGKTTLSNALTVGNTTTLNGAIILSDKSYGATAPSSATAGQLFFVEAK